MPYTISCNQCHTTIGLHVPKDISDETKEQMKVLVPFQVCDHLFVTTNICQLGHVTYSTNYSTNPTPAYRACVKCKKMGMTDTKIQRILDQKKDMERREQGRQYKQEFLASSYENYVIVIEFILRVDRRPTSPFWEKTEVPKYETRKESFLLPKGFIEEDIILGNQINVNDRRLLFLLPDSDYEIQVVSATVMRKLKFS